MIAAIYARKSSEQAGVNDDQKSIARQVEHARAYAAANGWIVADAHVYVDDGISGAEFSTRPSFVRLLNAIRPRRTPFEILIVSELSRLGREQLETGYALKQLSQAGVRVWSYLEGREVLLDTPTDKFLMSAVSFAAELERDKARQRTYDALQRKARAGHVTGGRVFGYDNVHVPGADGRRSHVERRINEDEAAIVRQIFEWCAGGTGYTRIAKQLNEAGAPAPRPQQARPAGWAPSTVNEVLHRPLYRGEIVWNRSRKRNRWGQHDQTARPEGEWLRLPAPELRIVPDVLWDTVHGRLASIRGRLQEATGAKLGVRSRDIESRHLLPGFARCALCGGSLAALGRDHGQERVFFYGCLAHRKRGPRICGNDLELRVANIDEAVLRRLGGDVLRPAVVQAMIDGVFDAAA